MTESVSLWQDMQSDRFYLLNNTTGYKTKVNSNTDYVKEFDSILTGQVGYKQRVEYAIQKNKPGYMPLKIEGLKPLKSTLFYTPQNDKFEGYSQFPQPRTQPYFNQKRDLQSNPNKRLEISHQKTRFHPDSGENVTLYQYDGLKKDNIGIPHLTNTLKDHIELSSTQKIKILGERQITKFQDMNHVSSQPNLSTSTKMINGRLLLAPSDTQLVKQRRHQALNKLLSSKTIQSSKISEDLEPPSNYKEPLEKEKSQLIQTFMQEKDTREGDHKHFVLASHFYQTQTFDGRSFSNCNRPQTTNIKNESEFQKELILNKQQLESFKIPIKLEKSKISTIGRFNVQVKTTREQDIQDRKAMIQRNPEMLLEVVDPKKQKQEEVRRNTNRLKEQELLERNLRNKL